MNKIFGLALLAAVTGAAAGAQAFEVTSPDIQEGGTLNPAQVYQGFGCSGGNRSPALNWSGEPAGTKSFAVTLYDPDAPSGSGWWHWTVVNLPASVHALPAGAGSKGGKLAAGAVQGRTDFGTSLFGGACPPTGDKPHRYVLTVWALKTDKLPLNSGASGALVGFMLNANALGKATLTATYGR